MDSEGKLMYPRLYWCINQLIKFALVGVVKGVSNYAFTIMFIDPYALLNLICNHI